MSIIDITSGQAYATVSAAILGSGNGDVIALDAGHYSEYFPTINHDLTIQGVGGLAFLTTPGSPTNGKGILVTNANVVLRNLDLSGAAVPDNNGAGIRYEGGTLLVANTRIHDNQDGILADPFAGGTISIVDSELDHNGAGDGLSHNLYVNRIDRLTISNSFFHDAIAGHEIKSRADVTIITDNRIQDQQGNSSYSIDLPDGGAATITGNTFQKGPNTENWTSIHYGGERPPSYANSTVTVSNNTFINDLPPGTNPRVLVNETTDGNGNAYPATVADNTLYGFPGTSFVTGPNTMVGANLELPLSAAPPLDTSSAFDVAEPASAILLAAALLLSLLATRAGPIQALSRIIR